jgi:hypothetical protein
MKLTAEQKLKILSRVGPGERHAIETLWGLASEFYVYLFQCFKASQKEGLGAEYDALKTAFPEDEEAYREYLRGNLGGKIDAILEDKSNG